jgi:hypothetical protein
MYTYERCHMQGNHNFISVQWNQRDALFIQLIRIKVLYEFWSLFAHPQEAHTKGTWYIACVLCQLAALGLVWNCSTPILVQPIDITHTQYIECRLLNASWGWARNVWNMQRPLILNKMNKKCITLDPPYWCTMMRGQQNIKFIILVFIAVRKYEILWNF